MIRIASLVSSTIVPFLLVACSSSSSPSSGGGTSPAPDGGAGGCACDISYNGASRTISCGTDTCLNNVAFTCGQNADITQGGACTGNGGSDSGSGSGSGQSQNCNASGTFDCGGAGVASCHLNDEYCAIGDHDYSGSIGYPYICASLPSSTGACKDCAWLLSKKGCFQGGTPTCTGSQQTGFTITCTY